MMPLAVLAVIHDYVYEKYRKLYPRNDDYIGARTNSETALYIFLMSQALAVLHTVAYFDTLDADFLKMVGLWQTVSGIVFIVYLYYRRKVKEFEKLQMIQEAIAKGVEIGMKKAKET